VGSISTVGDIDYSGLREKVCPRLTSKRGRAGSTKKDTNESEAVKAEEHLAQSRNEEKMRGGRRGEKEWSINGQETVKSGRDQTGNVDDRLHIRPGPMGWQDGNVKSRPSRYGSARGRVVTRGKGVRAWRFSYSVLTHSRSVAYGKTAHTKPRVDYRQATEGRSGYRPMVSVIS
jgi:hypothetical protein